MGKEFTLKSIHINKQLHLELKNICDKEGYKINKLVEKLIIEFISINKK